MRLRVVVKKDKGKARDAQRRGYKVESDCKRCKSDAINYNLYFEFCPCLFVLIIFITIVSKMEDCLS